MTATAVRPPARFGGLIFDGDRIAEFTEKPQIGEGWINGGFFVMESAALEYIAGDQTSWEREPMERLAAEGNLMAYRHEEFWQCMDTLRDLRLLEGLWTGGRSVEGVAELTDFKAWVRLSPYVCVAQPQSTGLILVKVHDSNSGDFCILSR